MVGCFIALTYTYESSDVKIGTRFKWSKGEVDF